MLRELLVIAAITVYVQCAVPIDKKEWRLLSSVGDIWTDCSKPDDPAKISNVSIVPDPPKISQNVTISATLTSNEVVTAGKVNIDITYNDIIPFKVSYDLCELTKKINHPCPLQKGQWFVSVPTKIPKEAPKGPYEGKVTATDQSGNELGCISLKFNLN